MNFGYVTMNGVNSNGFHVRRLICKKIFEILYFGWIYDIMVVSGKQKVFSGYFYKKKIVKLQDPFIRSWYMLENRLWNRND